MQPLRRREQQRAILHVDVARALERRFTYTLLLLVVVPRVVFSSSFADAAVAVSVWWVAWVMVAVTPLPARLPRAVVHRARGARLRRWADAAFIHLGQARLGVGSRACMSPFLLTLPRPHSRDERV
jgi:hypothetical protein